MKGRIPSNIDIDKLVRDLKDKNGKKLREDKKRFIQEGMVYILNQLTYDVYNTDKREDGFKRLNNKILEDVIGQKRPKIIFDILLSKEIVEVRHKINRFQSTGYRLTTKYCTGEFKEIEYSERVKRKLVELKNTTENDVDIDVIDEYEYLRNQFNGHYLSIKTFDSYNELRKILIPLLNKSLQKKKFKTETVVSLLNLIGGYKHKLEDLKDEKYNLKLSSSNLRFHSIISSLKKELRQFLRFKGEKLVEVDIKSSQPFILSTILNEYFTTSVENGYNLFTIYPELFDIFQKVKSIIPTNTPNRTKYILGVHFTPESVTKLENFTNYNFENDFYENVLVNGRLISNSPTLNQRVNSKGRSFVKKHIMNYLFEWNEENKSRNLVIEKIDSLYPDLGDFIQRFHTYYGKSRLSYLLQRTESYLVLKETCGYINRTYPQIPFFTIHDSILTTQQYSSRVKDILTDVISVLTYKNPVVTIKENDVNIDVNKIWTKVNITNQDKFEKRKYSISKVEIDKGLSLISDQELKMKVKEVIRPYMKNFH